MGDAHQAEFLQDGVLLCEWDVDDGQVSVTRFLFQSANVNFKSEFHSSRREVGEENSQVNLRNGVVLL